MFSLMIVLKLMVPLMIGFISVTWLWLLPFSEEKSTCTQQQTHIAGFVDIDVALAYMHFEQVCLCGFHSDTVF
jgi:hypothetical protein